MELKKVTKTTHYVDSFDLADFIGEKIGRSVEIIDTPNDTDYSATVKKEELDDWDMKSVSLLKDKGYISMEYGFHQIMTYCANQNWIEEGNYVIKVSW